MKKVISVCLLIVCIAGCGSESDVQYFKAKNYDAKLRKDKIFGTWKITKYRAGEYFGMEPNEAESYVGKTIKISDKIVKDPIAIKTSCDQPEFELKVISNVHEYFLRGYKINEKKYGLDAENIYEISVDCELDLFYYYFGKKDLLVTNQGGHFFYLKKTNKEKDTSNTTS